MPRKGEVPKRKVLPDPKYTDAPPDMRRKVTQFVNLIMRDGKKAVAEGIVYKAFDMVAERAKDDPLKVWERALSNVRPRVEVKSRRVGGASLQVPVEVRPERRAALAMRWLLTSARARTEKTMSDRLAAELILASKGEGNAMKKKEDTHRMAEANRAFAHYRW